MQSPGSESSVEARWAPPLDRLVTARGTDVSLRDALDRLAVLAKLHLSYSSELLPLDRVVCLAANAMPVGRVLAELLAGLHVAAVGLGGDQVVITPHAGDTPPTEANSDAMARSLGVLDRVVVTGSTAGTPQREVTVGLNVVDGRELERENTGTVSSTLDSYVPGIWSWAQSPASLVTSYASIRGASSFGLSYPKMYIDGIEVANPLLVSRLTPGSIDHIEVVRGPQGAALYGTDAISGVVNIVTRHEGADADGTHAALRTTAGITQSDYAHGVLTQDHALSLATGTSTRSADLNIAAGSVGNFIPDGFSQNLMATGSARLVGTRTTLSATARLFTEKAGPATSPLLTPRAQTRMQPYVGSGATSPVVSNAAAPQSIQEYTLATNATLTGGPDDRWTHSLVAGIDGYRLANVQTDPTPIPSVTDSALRAAQGGADRATVRASSVLHFRADAPTHGTLTFSLEHSTMRENSVSNPPITPNAKSSVVHGMVRDLVSWQNSTGFTTQANTVLNNSFFATTGIRFERDSRLVGADELVALPMIGGAAVQDYGPFNVKLRAAYGKGIRPPSALGHVQFWQMQNGWLTDQALGPEEQSGTEVGLDVYFRHALSLQVTRFDQYASGLIQQVAVPADSAMESRRVTYVLQNVGEISNRGWELGATGAVSRLSVAGTLSFVDSRVTKLAAGYTGDLLTGDRMPLVPASTGSLTFTWNARQWYASLGGSRALDWINYDELSLTRAFMSGTRTARQMLGTQLRQYWRKYNGGLRLRATASRDIRDGFSIEFSADNLLNYQRDEPDNITVLPGRSLMTGIRVKF